MFYQDKIELKSLIIASLCTALMAISAFIKLPGPLVPITLQTAFVIITAFLLGPKVSVISVGLYMIIGLIGFPVFTQGGGITYIFQPSFGYVIGFLAAAPVMSKIAGRKREVSFVKLLVTSLIGILIIYLFGGLYLYGIVTVIQGGVMTITTLIVSYFLVFVPGDLIMAVVAVSVCKRLRKVLK